MLFIFKDTNILIWILFIRVEFMSSSEAIVQLDIIFAKYFNKEEINYLCPLLVKWSGSHQEAIRWFQEQPIPAFGNKTGLDMCKRNQAKSLIEYVQAMELGGFA